MAIVYLCIAGGTVCHGMPTPRTEAPDILPSGRVHGQLRTPWTCSSSVYTTCWRPLGGYVAHTFIVQLMPLLPEVYVDAGTEPIHLHPLDPSRTNSCDGNIERWQHHPLC